MDKVTLPIEDLEEILEINSEIEDASNETNFDSIAKILESKKTALLSQIQEKFSSQEEYISKMINSKKVICDINSNCELNELTKLVAYLKYILSAESNLEEKRKAKRNKDFNESISNHKNNLH